jgi:hypothetical protein
MAHVNRKSIKSRFLGAVSAVSLLLCVYAAALAVLAPSGSGYTLFQPLTPPRPYTGSDVAAYKLPAPTFELAGFRIQRSISVDYVWTDGRIYVIPWWFLTMLWAIMPAVWLRARLHRRRRFQRVQRGLCPSCGYDMRQTPQRCPECGEAAGAAEKGTSLFNSDPWPAARP